MSTLICPTCDNDFEADMDRDADELMACPCGKRLTRKQWEEYECHEIIPLPASPEDEFVAAVLRDYFEEADVQFVNEDVGGEMYRTWLIGDQGGEAYWDGPSDPDWRVLIFDKDWELCPDPDDEDGLTKDSPEHVVIWTALRIWDGTHAKSLLPTHPTAAADRTEGV